MGSTPICSPGLLGFSPGFCGVCAICKLLMRFLSRPLERVMQKAKHSWNLCNWSDRPTQRTSARARTDAKNPIHKSKFRRSIPCFKGATSTRAVKSIHFLHFFASRTPSFVFHGDHAHVLSASNRRFFRGKTRISPIFCHCATRWSLFCRGGRSVKSRKSIHFSNSESREPLALFVSRRSVTQNKAFSARFCPAHEPGFFRKSRFIFRNS